MHSYRVSAALVIAAVSFAYAPGLTLDQARQIALRENNTISVLNNRIEENRRKVATAQTGYRPQFQLLGSYTYVSRLPHLKIDLPMVSSPPEIQTATHHVTDAKLQAGYLLFDFGKRRKSVGMAVLGKEISEVSLVSGQQEVAYRVSLEYANAALVGERKRLVERYIEIAQRHLDDTQTLFDNGLASQFDLLKSEMQLKVYQEQLAASEAELRAALYSLRETIGSDSAIAVDESLAAISIVAPAAGEIDAAKLAESKPEVVALRKQQEVSQLAIGLEQLRPSVSLISSAGWKNTYMPDPDKLLFNYSGGVAISYPFYDGGRAKSRRVEEREKQKTLGLEIERIVSQTQTAERVVRAELEKIEAKSRITSERLALAKRALEIAQVSYNTGMITNTDYLDTELDVQEIETEALADRHALLLARLELKRVLSYWPELSQ